MFPAFDFAAKYRMKIRLSLLAFLITLPALAGTVTPTWTFTDFGLDALTVKKMRVTPIAPYGTNGSGIITGDWRERTTDTNGSVTLTNIANGYSYRVEFSGPWAKTSFTNSFDGTVTGAVNAVDYISSTLVSDAGLVAYSKLQANGLFLTKTNSAMIGTPTVNGTNLVSLVSGGGTSLTLSNTTSTVGLTNGNVGIGTNTAHLVGTNLWVSGSNALSVAARYIGGATIFRSTSNIPYSTLMEATTNWLAGDTVELWGTNIITTNIAWPVGLVMKARSDKSSATIVQSNYWFWTTNNMVVQDITFYNPLTNVTSDVYPLIRYAGTNNSTNMVFDRCRFVDANSGVWLSGDAADNPSIISASFDGCYFQSDSWSWVRIINASTNSTLLIRNFQGYAYFDESRGSGPVVCGFRLNAGVTTLKNGIVTVKNAPTENIGVYSTSGLIIDNVTFKDCVVTNGATAPQNILLQTGANIFGDFTISDINHDSAVDTSTVNWNEVSGNGLGFNEIGITGTGGLSVNTNGLSKRLPNTFCFWRNRTNWMNEMQMFAYSSNTFAGQAQTNLVLVTNSTGLSYSIYATNGLVGTNIGGVDYLVTVGSKDVMLCTNRGVMIGAIYSLGGRGVTNLSGLTASNIVFTVTVPKYTSGGSVISSNVGTTISDTSDSYFYYPSNTLTNWSYSISGPSAGVVAIRQIETYAATSGRAVRFNLDGSNIPPPAQVITNNDQRSLTLGASSTLVTVNTNTLYGIGGGSASANAKYIWSGSAYTNTANVNRWVSNFSATASDIRVVAAGTVNYSNSTFAGGFTPVSGSSPGVTNYFEASYTLRGSVLITNHTTFNVAGSFFVSGATNIGGGITNIAGTGMFQAENGLSNLLWATQFKTNAGFATGVSLIWEGNANGNSVSSSNLTTGTLNVTGNATNNTLSVNSITDVTNFPSFSFGALYAWNAMVISSNGLATSAWNNQASYGSIICNTNAGYLSNTLTATWIVSFNLGKGSANNGGQVFVLKTNGVSTCRTNTVYVDTVRGGGFTEILRIPANSYLQVYQDTGSPQTFLGELNIRYLAP